MPQLLGIAIAFLAFMTLAAIVSRFQQPQRRLPILRRGFATDTAYWFFTSLITERVVRFALAITLLPLPFMLFDTPDFERLQYGFGPLSRQPYWLQGLLMIVLADFMGYWMHRAFHGRSLWPFHAIHHASVDLDWLSTLRVHPINEILTRAATALPLILLGFAPIALAGVLPFLTIMAILAHTNIDWDYGPLRTIIVSPRFHRWHHTDETEARDKNFAGLLPLWDILFGTYYMPRDRLPQSFGTSTDVPTGLFGQLLFPFRRSTAKQKATKSTT